MVSSSAHQPGQQERRRLYRNTAVFAILAAATTVLLLGILMAVPSASGYRIVFFTAVAGLIAVLIYALVTVAKFEKRVRDRLNNAQKAVVSSESCPDFYTARRNPDGTTVCINGVTSRDSGNSFEYVGTTERPVEARINLDTVVGRKFSEVCSTVDPAEAEVPTYNAAWTGLRPRCDALAATR